MSTFRGEDPDSTHLNQFFHSEVEIQGQLKDVLSLVGKYIHKLTLQILSRKGEFIQQTIGTVGHLEKLLQFDGRFLEIPCEDAFKILKNIDGGLVKTEGDGIKVSRQGEQFLLSQNNGNPLWLTYPDAITVPFYQALNNESKTARCADLLLGPGEIVGCGERHKTAEQVLESLNRQHVDATEYAWYLRMKREHPM